MSPLTTTQAQALVRSKYETEGIPDAIVEASEYPQETILVVRVPPHHYDAAVRVGNALDHELETQGFHGFVTVRKLDESGAAGTQPHRLESLADPRVTQLANLLHARSRTSEVQPSLSYIPDAANTLSAILESRNHLVFGRRGAGKTALLVEAKKMLEARNNLTTWTNVQTIRNEGAWRAFLWVARAVLEALVVRLRPMRTQLLGEINELSEEIQRRLGAGTTTPQQAQQMVPKLQRAISRALATCNCSLFLFLDDLHYLKKSEQPAFLDLLHGIIRDTNAWLKVAAIRHLSRWFQASPPLGLQSSHDAAHIDLDLTLESPSEAKQFLDRVLDTYAEHVGIRGGRAVFSENALDRLVLAAGAVPRDYLELAVGSIREAKKRTKARGVGMQDVNRAAGEQSKVKLQELEDDAAAAVEGGAASILAALAGVRTFCLDEKHCSFFRVDFREKERRPEEYALLQALLDVRIIHLVSPSLSDKHAAGRRAEVFMLDLSQFSGQRLKKYLVVLDFVRGHMVLKETSSGLPARVGSTSRKLQEILRRGPMFDLRNLRSANESEAALTKSQNSA